MYGGLATIRVRVPTYEASPSSSALAPFRSRVSKPSVNRPYTGASSSRACYGLPWSLGLQQKISFRALVLGLGRRTKPSHGGCCAPDKASWQNGKAPSPAFSLTRRGSFYLSACPHPEPDGRSISFTASRLRPSLSSVRQTKRPADNSSRNAGWGLRVSRTGATGGLEIGRLPNRQCFYGLSLSISALSAASIVRYDASMAITRDPASAIQPVWPTRSISAHCSESSRAPRIELVPLIICAARWMLGTSARAAASRSTERTDGV